MTHQSEITQPLTWNGSQFIIRARTSETNDALGIFESIDQPSEGPPRHIHDDADETFVILSGEAEFWLNGTLSQHSAGETVFIPRGAEHTYRVLGNQPARMLTIMTPGGFEDFFTEMAEGGYRIPQDMGPIMEIAARYQLRFTGPPLAAAA